MKLKILLLSLVFATTFSTYAQDKTKAFYQGKVSSVEYVSSMQSRLNDLLPSDNSVREAKDKRSLGGQITANKDPQKEDDYFF